MAIQVRKEEKKPPREILAGCQGIGKSTYGAESPSPLFICTEEGASRLSVDRLELKGDAVMHSWPQFLDALQTVLNDPEAKKYKTLVIDTIDGAVKALEEYVCKRDFGGVWSAENNGYLSWGRGPEVTRKELRQILNTFDDIRDEHGMHILLLCHDGVQTVRHPIKGDYQRIAGDMDRKTWGLIVDWADLVGHADYQYRVLPGKGNGPGRVLDTNVRLIRWVGTVAESAKCRAGFEMPAETPLDRQAVLAEIGKPKVTPEQVQVYLDMLPEDRVQGALNWLGTPVKKASPRRLLELIEIIKGIVNQQPANAADSTKQEEK